MAVTKSDYLNEAGVQTLSEYLLRCTNSRIRERILTSLTSAAYSDSTHVLSAQAILGNIGDLSDYANMDGTENTVLGKVKALDLKVGESTDVATDNTVYGAIAAVRAEISSLTHLTYQVVEGPITDVVDPAEDVIYLQHDAATYAKGTDNYLLDANGVHATANDGVDDYEVWQDPSDNKFYKMVGGVKGAEIFDTGASVDPIFANVALVEDTTYNLYIWAKTQETPTVVHEWICVGDTSIELSGYWSKNDVDTNLLKNTILEPLSSATIIAKVQAAWNATDPYANPDTNSYVPSDWNA